MKKSKIVSAAAALIIAGTLSAQPYLKSLTGNSSSAISNVVQCNWNSTLNNPSTLFSKSSGFSIVNFNENTGAHTSGNGLSLGSGLLKMTAACMANAGGNTMVLTYDKTQIYYSFVNTTTIMPVYTYSFTRTIGNTITSAVPVDIVYDGSQYFYVLLSCTYANTGANTYAYGKIDALTGTLSTFYDLGTVSVPGEAYYPTDMEYVDNNHIYITGRYYTGTTTYFFFSSIKSTFAMNALRSIDYNTSTLTPSTMHVKASGTSLWFVGDFINSANSSSPLLIANITDAGAGVFTVNSATRITDNMMRITSVDMRSGKIAVGSNNATNSAPMNLLFNTSTASVMNVTSYLNTGNNVLPRTIFSPNSSCVWSILRDNSLTGMYDLRSYINQTQNDCSNGVNYTPVSVILPISSPAYAFKWEIPASMSITSLGVGYTWTTSSQCIAAPQQDEPGDAQVAVARKSNAVVAPNPASDIVTVAAAEEKQISSVEIYSVTGQLLYTLQPENAATVTVSTSSLENGIYLFVIRNADGTVENKNVVVNH